MPAAAHGANTHLHVRTIFLNQLKGLGLSETVMIHRFAAHAMVRIVPVVSELLNLIENVSPLCNVSADP